MTDDFARGQQTARLTIIALLDKHARLWRDMELGAIRTDREADAAKYHHTAGVLDQLAADLREQARQAA